MTANTPIDVPEARKASPVGNWKKSSQTPIELPSGEFMRIRRMSMSTLMATGKMPNSLIKIVQKAVDTGTGMEEVEEDMGDILGDQEMMREMGTFLDNLIVMLAVEPQVWPTPKTESDRKDTLLYADEIDQDDKSFIFGIVSGGPADLAKFRETTEANVAALSGRSNVVVPTERTAEDD